MLRGRNHLWLGVEAQVWHPNFSEVEAGGLCVSLQHSFNGLGFLTQSQKIPNFKIIFIVVTFSK